MSMIFLFYRSFYCSFNVLLEHRPVVISKQASMYVSQRAQKPLTPPSREFPPKAFLWRNLWTGKLIDLRCEVIRNTHTVSRSFQPSNKSHQFLWSLFTSICRSHDIQRWGAWCEHSPESFICAFNLVKS